MFCLLDTVIFSLQACDKEFDVAYHCHVVKYPVGDWKYVKLWKTADVYLKVWTWNRKSILILFSK